MYPIGIHFGISQLVAGAALLWISRRGLGMEEYYRNMMMLTGVSGLLAAIPALYFYEKDKKCRISRGLVSRTEKKSLLPIEVMILLAMGAALSMFGNMLMTLLQGIVDSSSYTSSMEMIQEGKSFWDMLFWFGIVAPFAEEVIFRWLVFLRLRDWMSLKKAALISGIIFGIYHGNLIQAIYAGLLGFAFAYLLELSRSLWGSVLLHMGANCWSVFLMVYGERAASRGGPGGILLLYVLLLGIFILGFRYFQKSR